MARIKFTFKRLRVGLDDSESDEFNFDSDEDDEAETETAAALAAVEIPEDKLAVVGRSVVKDATEALLPTLGKRKATARDVGGWEPQRQWKKPRLHVMPTTSTTDRAPRHMQPLFPVSRLAAAGRVEVGSSFARHSTTTDTSNLLEVQAFTTTSTGRTEVGRVEKPKIIVMRGDPTDWSTAAIVNDANSLLFRNSGLGATIVRKGGLEIQRQSNAWVYYHGEVSVGSAMWTTAGKLSSTVVIHAVGPDVSHHRWPTQQHQLDLRRAVRSALAIADDLGVKSIAMPAISTGRARYPKYLAAREIVAECLQFCDEFPSTTLRLIVLMNEDEVTTSIFTQALKEEKQQRQLQSQWCNGVQTTYTNPTNLSILQQTPSAKEEDMSTAAASRLSALKWTV
ncbi:hypothetical protein PR003_g15057 [Phytophthora rubi]|uniref:Macro domain-containing protein n=1 Tax=Phytophthora rubi TaxID=129364 RepID=A0A6A3L055_9STRA|nr:hypothetical protein PR002_g14660 [Phytophthora rubi]KAE9018134.1 hypothetical protein PR001_g14220 [Phytophthora rubi]KAE9331341.1 hypothetical protein PR003_g15057 [Phytophthora rubi]